MNYLRPAESNARTETAPSFDGIALVNAPQPIPWFSTPVVVVPFTTRDRGIPLHVRVSPPEGGLRDPSVLLPEQLYAADHSRLVEGWTACQQRRCAESPIACASSSTCPDQIPTLFAIIWRRPGRSEH